MLCSSVQVVTRYGFPGVPLPDIAKQKPAKKSSKIMKVVVFMTNYI